jgi:MFS family permease
MGPRAAVQGGVVAAMPGGSWLGALCSGIITDWLGRKNAILTGACLWLVGSAIMAAAQNLRKPSHSSSHNPC